MGLGVSRTTRHSQNVLFVCDLPSVFFFSWVLLLEEVFCETTRFPHVRVYYTMSSIRRSSCWFGALVQEFMVRRDCLIYAQYIGKWQLGGALLGGAWEGKLPLRVLQCLGLHVGWLFVWKIVYVIRRQTQHRGS